MYCGAHSATLGTFPARCVSFSILIHSIQVVDGPIKVKDISSVQYLPLKSVDTG